MVKPGHVVNRAHVDDIAEVTRLVLERGLGGQIWNVADDEPPAAGRHRLCLNAVRRRAAAGRALRDGKNSPTSASFFAKPRGVSNAKAKRLLGFPPAYPTDREGLRALLEAGEGRGGAAST